MSYIRLKKVNKYYRSGENRLHAIKDADLCIKKGEMVAIMGKSGCGKSTLLNVLGGLDQLDQGEYFLEDCDVGKLKGEKLAGFRRENIGFIVQHFALIDDFTVFNNIALPLRYRGMSKNEIKNQVEKLLVEFDISEKRNAYPTQLSGGQCQRVAIARAVVADSNIILADEPTGALDETTGASILDILKRLNSEGKTVIVVTHDHAVASVCNRVINMSDGRIMDGAIEDCNDSAS